MTDPRREPNDLYAFLEALLRLEWPGRRVAVTPAPFPDPMPDVLEAVTALTDERWVLDVTVSGLSSDEPAWVAFRVVVWDELARKDWLAVAAKVLEQARAEFGRWPGRSGSPAEDKPSTDDADINFDDIPELTEADFKHMILASVRRRIVKGEIESGTDITDVRRFVRLTPIEFAGAFGITVSTLKDWEAGACKPQGPAATLLRLAARHPRIIRELIGT